MYLLGIDGGGTKLDFLITDLDKKEVLHFQYEANSNLKYAGPANIIKLLSAGLDQITQTVPLNEISFTYLGIAECGRGCGIIGRDEIVVFLDSRLQKYFLGDDQYSVFRAKSDDKYGVLANAGTGSNINYFTPEQECTFKSLGMGGRDLGRIIIDLIVTGEIDEESEIYKYIRKYLQSKPTDFYHSLSQIELISNYEISQIPKVLVENCPSNHTLRDEMEFYAVFASSRWISKINSKCLLNFNLQPHNSFDLAMTGSLWKWGSMREKVIIGISKLYPNVNFCYDSLKKPVEGCVTIAKEILEAQEASLNGIPLVKVIV
jgi:hypothetical protein